MPSFKSFVSDNYRLVFGYALLVAVVIGCHSLPRQGTSGKEKKSGTDPHKTWRDFGGGPDQSKYFVQDEITKSNVNQLKVAWTYSTADENVYQFNPLIVDNIMYVLAKGNSLVALDAASGKEIWIHANLQGIAPRGINYWESKDRKDRRLIFQMNNYLQAIDALTGKSILNFGDNGLVDLRQGLGRDPLTVTRAQSGTPGKIFENLLLLGSSTGENYMSSPGDVRAYDVVTGKLAWTFHTIPHPGEYGYDTWPKDAYKYIGGVNTWGEISVDAERGIAYYPLGSPTYDYYGGDRIGSNLYGNSILALDARTGKRIWHYQLVHHDLWDYDLSAAPQLVTVNHDGKKIDAVAVAGKNGFMFVFDRVNGKPLWPIEERPVPASTVPGEQAWPTQPFPTVIPPFGRQDMTSKDLNQYFLKPRERAEWAKRIDSMGTGLYTPVSMTRETLSIPGAVGGASWGSTAANPEKGIVYVRSIDWPSVYGKVEKRDPPKDDESGENAVAANGQSIYATNCQACHGADRKGAVGPQLLDIASKLNFEKFQQLVFSGKGEMPAFPHLDEGTMRRLYRFMSETGDARAGGRPAPAKNQTPEGPVVASGGVPKGQELRELTAAMRNASRQGPNSYGVPYPDDAKVSATRYFIPPGWGLGYPFLISPPWSSIIAYDMNKGTIKWKIPIGQDLQATEEGGKNTGVLRSQRNGMIVTSTGLVFCTAKDGKIYAFDADNGKELWAGQLPTGTQGLPSMYELNGKHYLVVSATVPLVWGRGDEKTKPEKPAPQGRYVVFALP
ncbi:outer membrane protein assembly factor BamB family protein [Dyadobacter bucti]|uniref:outer membrane protein assembly factor BamB family protein n=1 Tax=Dyadobacter bucti TaxID=2572203 RepID=UPI001109B5CD|nr:PQQ-binding-like beta-propeller repeat protein [Dyadobacter bucti]